MLFFIVGWWAFEQVFPGISLVFAVYAVRGRQKEQAHGTFDTDNMDRQIRAIKNEDSLAKDSSAKSCEWGRSRGKEIRSLYV